MEEMLSRLRGGYARHAPELVAPLLDLLIAARQAYGGDIDMVLILLSVGMRQAEHGACRELSYEEVRRGVQASLPGSGTNVRSIAESTGIPRETVRRKVDGLEQAGLLERREHQLFCTPASFQDFGAVREALIRLAARNRRTVEAMLAPADEVAGAVAG
jgi:hypothetical protein